MKIIVTAKELMDKGSWEEFCRLRHINEYAVKEGMLPDSEFTLTGEEAEQLNFIVITD